MDVFFLRVSLFANITHFVHSPDRNPSVFEGSRTPGWVRLPTTDPSVSDGIWDGIRSPARKNTLLWGRKVGGGGGWWGDLFELQSERVVGGHSS